MFYAKDFSNEEEVLKELNTGTLEERMEKTIRFCARVQGLFHAHMFEHFGLAQGRRIPEDLVEIVKEDVLNEAKRVSALVDQKDKEEE